MNSVTCSACPTIEFRPKAAKLKHSTGGTGLRNIRTVQISHGTERSCAPYPAMHNFPSNHVQQFADAIGSETKLVVD
jgi:hypothetical protein